MIRNFALTLGAIASRFWIPVMVLGILPQIHGPIYDDALVVAHDIASGSAWLGLTVNLVVAETYLQRRYGTRTRPATRVPDRRTGDGAPVAARP